MELQSQTNVTQPHDRFGRKVIADVAIAADLLRYYADPVVAESVNLDELQLASTQHFGKLFDEYFADVSFLGRLLTDTAEILFTQELKSRPAYFVPIQLNAYSALALYSDFKSAGRPENKGKFSPKLLIMVLIYTGAEDINEEIWFQDIYESVPESLRQYVPQFRILLVNLRRYDYDHLPGRPETQAVVEAMKRATDGTFADNLDHVIANFSGVSLDDRIGDLIQDIVYYCAVTDELTAEQIDGAILKTLKGQEGIEMSQTVQKGTTQVGIGLIKVGYQRGKAESLHRVLDARFQSVPKDVGDRISQIGDLVVLDSLTVTAATCQSLEEFEEALR